jgi:hypothetical protein
MAIAAWRYLAQTQLIEFIEIEAQLENIEHSPFLVFSPVPNAEQPQV